MFGLNAGEDIVLVAACSRAVKKGRRPVAVNSLAGLPIYQRDRAVVIHFEDIRVIRLHMEPPVRIVVPPQPRTFRKYCAQSERTATSPSCKHSSAAQRGRDACGTAIRISASLSRRLSASFWRTPGQDPKAAKFAVLTPGPGMFVNVRNAPRVVIAALSGRPLFRRVSRCVRSCWRRRVCTRFHPRKQTWAVLQAIATRVFLPRGTH